MSGPAAVAIARALTRSRPVYVLGVAAPRGDGWLELPEVDAEDTLRRTAPEGAAVVVAGNLGSSWRRDRILRRAPAWGLTAIWLGAKDAPEPGLALRVESGDPPAALTALADSAQALLARPDALVPAVPECTDEVCITCSDEGRLGEVVVPPAAFFEPAVVRTADGMEEVDTTLVGEVEPGDLVLIHAGGAIARLSEPLDAEEAR